MNKTQYLAGIVLYSPDPQRLAGFYRDAIGVSLQSTRHGSLGNHQEGSLGDIHFAVWGAKEGHAAAPLVPVFRVDDLDQSSAVMERAGAHLLHKAVDLGGGKRVAGYTDPDGNAFRIIQMV